MRSPPFVSSAPRASLAVASLHHLLGSALAPLPGSPPGSRTPLVCSCALRASLAVASLHHLLGSALAPLPGSPPGFSHAPRLFVRPAMLTRCRLAPSSARLRARSAPRIAAGFSHAPRLFVRPA